MAVTYWTGASTNSWNQDNGDWSGNAPAAGDAAVFDSRSAEDVTTDIGEASIALTGGAAFCPTLIHIKSGYTGDIGTSSDYLLVGDAAAGAINLKIIHEGTGTAYIQCAEDDDTTDSEIELIVLNNPSATMYLKSDENDAGNISAIKKVLLVAGTLYIEDSCWVDTLVLAPRSQDAGNATVTIGTGCVRVKASADTMDITMQDGNLTSDSGANIVRMYQGTYNLGSASGGGAAVDITELQLFGGLFNWYPDEAAAYIGTLLNFGGVLDASGTTNATRAKVLGGGDLKDIYLFEGASIDISNGKGNITIATNSRFYNHGGIFTPDDYAEIAISYDTA